MFTYKKMASNNQFVTFNNGENYPILGFGTWKSKPGEVEEAVKVAIDTGYRHLDCAMFYGNEKEIGDAINQKIDEGVVSRQDLYITSKLWNIFHQPDIVETVLNKTLTDLQISYLDLYLIHWPMAFKVQYTGTDQIKPEYANDAKRRHLVDNSISSLIITFEGGLDDDFIPKDEDGVTIEGEGSYIETWQAMEQLVENGLVKSIGVSNFNKRQIEDIMNIATVKPVNNQVECHPYLNQSKLKEFCDENEIVLTAYSPLGSPDNPWRKPEDPSLLDNPTIVDIAGKHGKSAAHVLIRYQIQRGVMVIPKSVTKHRIESNFYVWDFELDQEDMDLIDGLDSNSRYIQMKGIEHFKDYPFIDEY